MRSSISPAHPWRVLGIMVLGFLALGWGLAWRVHAPWISRGATSQSHVALAGIPTELVWAWERQEDLRWLPAQAGVAYVAASVTLEGSQTRVALRAHALRVRDDTVLLPVVHVDASWRNPPVLDRAQRDAVANAVLAVAAQAARSDRPQAVQLDFEVRRSQRGFLVDVVRDIRRRLPPTTALSITALASWCAGDQWLDGIAADEVVPMAFRMGRDGAFLRAWLNQAGSFSGPRCRDAVGTAVDEPPVKVTAPRRYHFSPVPWTAETWRRAQGIPSERGTPPP